MKNKKKEFKNKKKQEQKVENERKKKKIKKKMKKRLTSWSLTSAMMIIIASPRCNKGLNRYELTLGS